MLIWRILTLLLILGFLNHTSGQGDIEPGQNYTVEEEYTSGTVVIFNNWNTYSVYNGAECYPSFTIDQPYRISYIDTYHWNNAQGKPEAGTIGLVADDGTTYGPWKARGEPGMYGVPNAGWICSPNVVIPADTYTIVDSDPDTWSQNSGSDGCGFSKVMGVKATTGSGQDEADSVVLLDTWNINWVDNNPSCQPSFTIDKPYRLTYIDTYHWNYGKGAPGGTISLRKDDGTVYGPWVVETLPGQGGVPNACWIARPDEVLPAGTYTVEDSDPETWAQNSESGGCGFSKVKGFPTIEELDSKPPYYEEPVKESNKVVLKAADALEKNDIDALQGLIINNGKDAFEGGLKVPQEDASKLASALRSAKVVEANPLIVFYEMDVEGKTYGFYVIQEDGEWKLSGF